MSAAGWLFVLLAAAVVAFFVLCCFIKAPAPGEKLGDDWTTDREPEPAPTTRPRDVALTCLAIAVLAFLGIVWVRMN